MGGRALRPRLANSEGRPAQVDCVGRLAGGKFARSMQASASTSPASRKHRPGLTAAEAGCDDLPAMSQMGRCKVAGAVPPATRQGLFGARVDDGETDIFPFAGPASRSPRC